MLPDERKFSGIGEFQKLLAEEPGRLLKNLTQQLAVYSTGRDVAFSDRQAIREIVERTEKRGGGIRSLVHELVGSELFRVK